ncbi:unnamed protein product [Rhizophagus irregularis]|nr:unnamed protein product [Rhizophagus irregularis]
MQQIIQQLHKLLYIKKSPDNLRVSSGLKCDALPYQGGGGQKREAAAYWGGGGQKHEALPYCKEHSEHALYHFDDHLITSFILLKND